MTDETFSGFRNNFGALRILLAAAVLFSDSFLLGDGVTDVSHSANDRRALHMCGGADDVSVSAVCRVAGAFAPRGICKLASGGALVPGACVLEEKQAFQVPNNPVTQQSGIA
jgi:hypothetical protein